MNNILTTAGNFRTVNVAIGSAEGVSHVVPPHGMVSNLMYDLFEWLQNSEEHPLIKSCVFHYEFEFIHPFSDGNSRIGRLWQRVILYAWREVFLAMPTESIVRDNQEAYYQALEDAGSVGESTPFIEFMLEVILTTVQSSVNTEDKILNYLEKNPKMTIKELSELLNLTSRAIEKQMANLKKEKRLVRVGSARKGHWKVKNAN